MRKTRYCDCGRPINVWMKGKGWRGKMKDHDLCDHCWRELRESQVQESKARGRDR